MDTPTLPGVLFTPFAPADMPGERIPDDLGNRRLRLRISEEDDRRFDLLPPRSGDHACVVTDLLTGTSYWVRRAPCGLGCYCAAEVVCHEC